MRKLMLALVAGCMSVAMAGAYAAAGSPADSDKAGRQGPGTAAGQQGATDPSAPKGGAASKSGATAGSSTAGSAGATTGTGASSTAGAGGSSAAAGGGMDDAKSSRRSRRAARAEKG